MFPLELFCICSNKLVLNPFISNFDNLALSSVDIVTTGTESFALVIVKVEFPTKLDRTQFGFHVNESSTLQLINGISNDLQKLLKYFSGTTILTPFLFVIKLDLYLSGDKIFGIRLASTVKSSQGKEMFRLFYLF